MVKIYVNFKEKLLNRVLFTLSAWSLRCGFKVLHFKLTYIRIAVRVAVMACQQRLNKVNLF